MSQYGGSAAALHVLLKLFNKLRKRNKIQGYAQNFITYSQHKIIELHINQLLMFSALQNMSVTPSTMHVHVHLIIYVDIVLLTVDAVLYLPV